MIKKANYIFLFLVFTIAAYFVAQIVNQIVVANYIIPNYQFPQYFQINSPSSSEVRNLAWRNRNSRLICEKNIFDYNKRPCVESLMNTSSVIESSETLVQCDSTVKVLATVAGTHPDWSFALLSINGENQLYRNNDQLENGFKITAINWRNIVLSKGKTDCKLDMWISQTSTTPIAEKTTPNIPPPPVKTNPVSSEKQGENNIEVVSDTERVVARDVVERFLDNPSELMSSVRIIPYERDGEVQGVRLFGIKRNSLLGELGIRNGDIIHNINDQPMQTPEQILQAYMGIRNQTHVSINVTRHGSPMTYDVSIR